MGNWAEAAGEDEEILGGGARFAAEGGNIALGSGGECRLWELLPCCARALGDKEGGSRTVEGSEADCNRWSRRRGRRRAGVVAGLSLRSIRGAVGSSTSLIALQEFLS